MHFEWIDASDGAAKRNQREPSTGIYERMCFRLVAATCSASGSITGCQTYFAHSKNNNHTSPKKKKCFPWFSKTRNRHAVRSRVTMFSTPFPENKGNLRKYTIIGANMDLLQ